jgi:hypothetical protein
MENNKENNAQAINFRRSGDYIKNIQININTAPNLISNNN